MQSPDDNFSIERVDNVTTVRDLRVPLSCPKKIIGSMPSRYVTNVAQALPASLSGKNANIQAIYSTQNNPFIYFLTPSEDPNNPNNINKFVLAVHEAYDKHIPIEISPDAIWLLIMQGFSIIVNCDPEKYRDDFVKFNDVRVCEMRHDEFVLNSKTNNWAVIVPEIEKFIKDNTSIDIYNCLAADFTTTNSYSHTASLASLCSTTNPYFDYKLTSNCAIPAFKITGDLDDWNKIKYRTKYICSMEMHWWWSDLMIIIDEIINTITGKSQNIDFWRSFYIHKQIGETSLIHGWINVLFPYILKNPLPLSQQIAHTEEPVDLMRNAIIGGWQSTIKQKSLGCRPGDYHKGFSIIDVDWYTYGALTKIEFCSGFMSASYNAKQNVIRPEIGWLIRKQ